MLPVYIGEVLTSHYIVNIVVLLPSGFYSISKIPLLIFILFTFSISFWPILLGVDLTYMI